MDAHRRYARARDQIYHYMVLQRQMHEKIPAKHRTTELIQLMEMCELVVEQAKEAFEAGQLLAMQLDRYEMVPLPGFEELVKDTKNPYRVEGD